MIDLLLVFVVSFVEVAPKAFQQRNVMGLHYLAVPFTSVVMMFGRYYAIYLVLFDMTNLKIFIASLGAALGCVCSMWLHSRLFK